MATDLNTLRSRLESEKKRLEAQLEQLEASVRSADETREGSPYGKREEEAAETQEFEHRLTLDKRIREQMAAVEHALHKFEDNTYGLCESCGKPMDPARLEALPHARRCITCKIKETGGKTSSG
ncbi:TraR/DksA family transcriptional regulator [Chloroflexota bacterium]